MNPFGTKSMEYTGGTDPNNANHKKGNLDSRLAEADTERRKVRMLLVLYFQTQSYSF